MHTSEGDRFRGRWGPGRPDYARQNSRGACGRDGSPLLSPRPPLWRQFKRKLEKFKKFKNKNLSERFKDKEHKRRESYELEVPFISFQQPRSQCPKRLQKRRGVAPGSNHKHTKRERGIEVEGESGKRGIKGR